MKKERLYKKNWKIHLYGKKRCGECGAEEGKIHKFGCDMECCPFCGEQLISCDCLAVTDAKDDSVGDYKFKDCKTEKETENSLYRIPKYMRILRRNMA